MRFAPVLGCNRVLASFFPARAVFPLSLLFFGNCREQVRFLYLRVSQKQYRKRPTRTKGRPADCESKKNSNAESGHFGVVKKAGEKLTKPPLPLPPTTTAPSAPAALRLRETLREAARRAAAASTAAVLSASAFLGAPTLDAVAAAGVATSSTTSAATNTTNTSTNTTYRLPVVSPDPDVLSVQRVLLQAWDIVDKAFVDGSFGGRDQVAWRGDLVNSLDAAAGAGAAGGGGSQGARLAELAIDAMLDRLGDPYTRRMPARDYESFRQSSEGEIAGGVGLLIAAQPVVAVGGEEEGKASTSSASPPPPSLPGSTGATSSSLSNSTRLRSRLVVLSPIEGGPAARAGIRPGDEVLAIDGHPTDGFDGESAAGMLRGPRGSSVVVDVARREVEEGNGELGSEGMVPGIPGRAPLKVSSATAMMMNNGGERKTQKKNLAPRVSIRQVRLRREKVELSPVTSSMLTVDEHGSEKASKKSSDSPSSQQQHRVGYLRLASFNARAASDTARALRQMRSQGAEAIVLDLRGNGGGLVRAAVDVSRALLPRGSTIFAVQGRSDVDVDGSDDDGIDNKLHHQRRLAAMTPPASPEDVVAASSGVPATAITQRVVLDDESGIPGEEGEGGGEGGRKNPTALARVMTMLPRLLSASGQRQPSSSSSSSDLLSAAAAAAAAPLSSTTPLAVLVDRNSASASEILAGALRDNGRAALVGERTYGKGKIQSVFPLRDGSALFVTVARYMTPSEELIDGVGIKPENACRGGAGGGGGGRNNDAASALLASLEMVPGVASEAGALQASLSADSCVLTAERLLLAQVEKQQQEQQGGGRGMAEDRRL